MIVSGAQTGADFGALLAAKVLGIPTFGYIPKGFRTENGPKPSLAAAFGIVEHESADYPPRTRANIEIADITVIISLLNAKERGSILTEKLCRDLNKPFRHLFLHSTRQPVQSSVDDVRGWLDRDHLTPSVWNFAGNRESISPGIEWWTRKFVIALFSA